MSTSQDLVIESFAARATPLRIALVTETFPPEVNGVAMTLGRIVDGMLARGHEVQVVRPRQAEESAPALRQGLDQVLALGVPIPSYPDLHLGLPAGKRLLKLWQQRRPDVVHVATEGPLGWSAVTAARKLQLPVTSSFHTNFDNYSQHYGIGLLKTPIDAYLRKLHNRTMATLVPTQELAQQLHVRGYRDVAVMSRGVAIEQFRPDCRSTALRAQWGAAPDDLVLLYVGRLAKEKNLGTVLSAYAAIRSSVPKAKLVFVGDGPMRQSLQQACPGAVYCGVRGGADLAAHYASGDLFLFPSVTETYGNVVPEALASGLAVLAYDQAAAGKLITNGRDGALVPSGDDLAFVNAAVALATDPQRLSLLRGQAAQAVAHLGWSQVFDGFVATLRSVIERRGSDFAQPALGTGAAIRQASA